MMIVSNVVLLDASFTKKYVQPFGSLSLTGQSPFLPLRILVSVSSSIAASATVREISGVLASCEPYSGHVASSCGRR